MCDSRSTCARLLAVLLSCALIQGCGATGSDTGSPLEPGSPATVGTLELTVHEVGALPDADGFDLTITLAAPEIPVLRVFTAGAGTLDFPDLPPGLHTLTVEGLASPCHVTGAHPRRFLIVAGETTQLDVFVSCPGPGTILVKTVTRGRDLGAGYQVSVAGRTSSLYPIGANDSLLIGEDDLPDGTDWRVSLAGSPENCWVDAPLSYVAPLNGKTVRREFYIACIPRGSRIAFQLAGGIYVTGGGEAAQVASVGGFRTRGPSLSPDGSRVLFLAASESLELSFGLIAADGSGATNWLSPQGDLATIGSQAWSPDGSRIVFSQAVGETADYDIYVMNVDGSGQTRITRGGWNGFPAWSPDGRSIAFCRLQGDFLDEYWELYRIDVDGSGERLLGLGCDPAWSPDGSRIVYTSFPGLTIIDADGSNPIPFQNDLMVDHLSYRPAWSPDGRWIAYTTGPLERIWFVEFDGSAFGEPVRYRPGGSPSWR